MTQTIINQIDNSWIYNHDITMNRGLKQQKNKQDTLISKCEAIPIKTMVGPNQFTENIVLLSESGIYYELSGILKESIFGAVVHAYVVNKNKSSPYFTRTTKERAIKVFCKSNVHNKEKTQENVLSELESMMKIGKNHPNLVKHYETFHDQNNIYVVLQYYNHGELFDKIKSNGPLCDKEAKNMFRQLIKALSSLKQLGIAHRDLSLENIMCHGRNEYSIIDFGMSISINSDVEFNLIPKLPICGKRNYIAPEVLREEEYFNPLLSDIWASGVILFIALTGIPPVDMATNADQRFRLISENKLSLLLNSWNIEMNPLAADLIQKILRSDPNQRLTIDEILNHPWLK